MKLLIYVLIPLFFFGCEDKFKNSQQNKNKVVDSLLKIVSSEATEKQKKIAILDSLVPTFSNTINDTVLRQNLVRVANQYYNLNELEKYKTATNYFIAYSQKAKDSVRLARGYLYLGDYFLDKSQYDSAFYYLNSAQKIYSKTKDIENFGRATLKKSYLQLKVKDLSGSEMTAIKALQLAQESKDYTLIYECYNCLGLILNEYKKFDEAIEYHSKALETIDKIEDLPHYTKLFKAQSYNNLGDVYCNAEDYSKAVTYFKKGIEIEDLIQIHPASYGATLSNLAYSEFKLGKEDVLDEYLRSLKIREDAKHIPGVIVSKIRLAEYYLTKKDTSKALLFIKDANQKAIEIEDYGLESETLVLLSRADKKNSPSYFQEYTDLNENIINDERIEKDKFARIQFETDEIITQKDLIEVEKNQLASQRIIILIISLLLILSAILGWLNLTQRSRNKELVFVQEQQKANQEIYKLMLDQQQKIEEGKQIEKKRISQELHDGVMGKLTSIRLNLFILSKKTDPETIEKCLNHINDIQNIEKEIRTIAHDLNKNLFSDSANFISVVKNLFIAIEAHSEVIFKLNLDQNIDWETIDSNIKMQIYRILQESLQNIEKHARASKVTVNIASIENAITVEIIDNGIGFDKKKTKSGIGLKNIYERIREIGGKVEINTAFGKGTKINLTIPI